MRESTECFAFSATFDKIPPLETASFIQPIKPPVWDVDSMLASRIGPCCIPLLGGIAALKMFKSKSKITLIHFLNY